MRVGSKHGYSSSIFGTQTGQIQMWIKRICIWDPSGWDPNAEQLLIRIWHPSGLDPNMDRRVSFEFFAVRFNFESNSGGVIGRIIKVVVN